MTRALRSLLTAVAALGLTATLSAQVVRLSTADRDRLLPLAERFSAQVADLNREMSRAAGPTTRNANFRTLVAELNGDAAAFRAALLRNRALDVEAEVQGLRESLGRVQDRIHFRRAPDSSLRLSAARAANILAQIERETASLESVGGKATARFEPGRYASVDDMDRLVSDLVDHSARMRARAESGGRAAPATAHFDEQVQQLQRVITRRGADSRPHLQRLQSDLNAALRELRRQGADDEAMAEWEWTDGLLDRMNDVARTNVTAREVPNELLGLSHDLHVQMMKAEELARAAGRGGVDFDRLGDQAYAFHHEMHDGRLSWTDAQDRVEAALRTFQRADAEIGRGGSAELRTQWATVRVTIEKMRSLMGV